MISARTAVVVIHIVWWVNGALVVIAGDDLRGTFMPLITRQTTIENLVENKPEAVSYLFRKGIRCIRCGEPIWGSLEEAAREKGFSDAEIDLFVEQLNQLNS